MLCGWINATVFSLFHLIWTLHSVCETEEQKKYSPDPKIEVSTETRPNLLWWRNVTPFPRIEKANVEVTPFRSASGCYIMVLRYSRMFRSVAALDIQCIRAIFDLWCSAVGDFSTARFRTGLCGTVQRNMGVECDSCWAVLGIGGVVRIITATFRKIGKSRIGSDWCFDKYVRVRALTDGWAVFSHKR